MITVGGNVPSLYAWVEQMGVMGWPLFISSVLALALMMEKVWEFIRLPALSDSIVRGYVIEANRAHDLKAYVASVTMGRSGVDVRKGIGILLMHASRHKSLREEVAHLWLQEQQSRVRSRLKLLFVIAVITPMMGLLGTVLGLIQMFGTLSTVNHAVTPALLATGLHQAMYTTAAGLCVAIPALAVAHGLGLWASHYIRRLVRALNQVNLQIEGVQTAELCYQESSLQSAVA